LGRRGGVYVWHPSFRIPRPPLPAPRSVTLQRPSDGTGWRHG